MLVVPATFNTINKWASGISDNLALGVLDELLSTGVPVLVVPCAKQPLREHPAYRPSTQRLIDAHATFMNPDQVTTRAPDGLTTFHWNPILDAFTRLTA
ncbi:flavoprotein [Saccharothrix sp. Mg75]|uniref:flavoprotein n=1 Tax=Saccharothrix sp. Mg75 TaxID=3445357 RepID=UPI003EEFC1FA